MFNKRIKILFIVIVVLVLAAATYAFAAANTVPASKAGDGNGVISGYTVSAIHYALNGTNPTTIDTVTFTLDVAPVTGGTIKIKLVSGGSTWYSCTNVTTAVTCTTTGAPVSTADSLQVVIAQ
jgi:TRAP-type C4-dicarboxylate transport system substrate-binding protein